ncbi:MAG: hypothetical protein PWP34_945 [Desulfuromonadales bacterium]|jgi:hypothetical protein|nr:hypothetical protein [Desulfuromonadales bacterium]
MLDTRGKKNMNTIHLFGVESYKEKVDGVSLADFPVGLFLNRKSDGKTFLRRHSGRQAI